MVKLPWIPSELQWQQILRSFASESIRNRLMLALAYDSALRREELCSLRTDDLDPAFRRPRRGGDGLCPTRRRPGFCSHLGRQATTGGVVLVVELSFATPTRPPPDPTTATNRRFVQHPSADVAVNNCRQTPEKPHRSESGGASDRPTR
jgi:hypothetical protein